MHRDYRYVHWIAVDPSETVFSFRVGTLLQVITIRLRKTGWWKFSRTHAIKTPLMHAPYWGDGIAETKEGACWHAVTGVSHYYGQAIEKDCIPDEGWLHPYFDIIEGDRAG
jgi:hypothetical protein